MGKSRLFFMFFAIMCLNLCEDAMSHPTYSINDRVLDTIILDALNGKEGQSWLPELLRSEEHGHKRNSEIINSLLGIPKVINDAGRK